MKTTDDRKLFDTPIGASAASGNIATIPQTQVKAGDGTASIALGFPPETFIARAAGGEPPRGQDMNGFLNRLSAAVQILQAGYLGPFDETFAQGIGGYPAGAIVSGSSPGTFWVSTADANVSTPGADGAKWQSLFNGYATQDWANSAFVKNNAGTQGGIVALDLDGDGSGRVTFQKVDGSWGALQPAGDYATSSALNTETSNRTNADTNLQNQINNRVQKTGDTIDWLTITGGSVTTTGYSGNDGVSGGIAYATGLTSAKQAGDTPLAIYRFINQNGVGPFATIWLTDNQGNGHELRFGADDRLRTASGNVFALESDISNLQSQINGKQPAGNYVTGLSAGKIIQDFVVPVTSSGVHNIAFPRSFSAPPTTIVISHGLTNGSNSSVSVLSGWTESGFQIQTNGATSINFLATGPS